ncbi:ferredoxin [Streptomyces fuscichromogenes]|uniref:ferredoxin n=1 Tax=Streptomyces fuscichromogenes TaxID=1324013 RepID=UPI0038182E01
MTLRISVDQAECCASSMCVLVAPDLFDQRDEDGIAYVLQPQPGPEQHAEARDAARRCPSLAITVHED